MSLRGRMRLRDRLHSLVDPDYILAMQNQAEEFKLHAELQFWADQWDSCLRNGKLWGQHLMGMDAVTLLKESKAFAEWDGRKPWSYEQLRQMEAEAQVLRICRELDLPNDYFTGKRVMNIGPGLVGFLEACGASLGIAVEPLARAFQERGLLLPSRHVIYLAVGAESLPLPDGSVDIVLSRNNLDHVNAPELVVKEVHRLLCSSGIFLLIVHLEDEPSPTEPHAFNEDKLHELLEEFKPVSERVETMEGRTEAGETFIGIYEKS